jgi:PP-loop superfamily ATP-utilizing enzyme
MVVVAAFATSAAGVNAVAITVTSRRITQDEYDKKAREAEATAE